MSDVFIKESTLTNIANAVREKNGTSEPIPTTELGSAIKNIPTGGSGGGYKIKDLSYICQSNRRLDEVPYIDTSGAESFFRMFDGSTGLTTLPMDILDTSNATNFNSMFYGCTALTDIPLLSDPSKVTSFRQMFYNCKSLTAVPEMLSREGTDFVQMFHNCASLIQVPYVDLNKAIDEDKSTLGNMFYGCKALVTLYLYNIRSSLTLGSGTTYGHQISVECLIHNIQELCTPPDGEFRTFTVGSANYEKLIGLYCRILDNEDEKKPMELCESTDEGAMSIIDYATSKNWLVQ